MVFHAGRLAAAAFAALLLGGDAPPAGHLADANDVALAMAGKQVYAGNCAACHGRYLQGQPLWRMDDANRHRRAPALDASGFAWQRSDDELFSVIAQAHYPAAAPDPTSRMPAFATRMPERDILAVLAFIKARWPTGPRVMQAALNDSPVGLPGDAAADWRLPPDCKPRATHARQ